MKFDSIIKHVLSYTFVLAMFFCADNAVHADTLLFKAGDKAFYTITQKINAEGIIFGDPIIHESEATIDFNVEILSSNPETLGYPFDVEINLRRMRVVQSESDGSSTDKIKYDSKSSKNSANPVLVKHLKKLIDHPLRFRVEDEFQVKETTGYLEEIYFDCDENLFGATPWTYELMLTQLFHLTGEDLQKENSYSVSCYQLLNFEDDPMDEEEQKIDQDSNYTVTAVNSKEIKASWLGEAKVTAAPDNEDGMDGTVSVNGHVTWNMKNPILQKRDLKVNLDATHPSSLDFKLKATIHQRWESSAL